MVNFPMPMLNARVLSFHMPRQLPWSICTNPYEGPKSRVLWHLGKSIMPMISRKHSLASTNNHDSTGQQYLSSFLYEISIVCIKTFSLVGSWYMFSTSPMPERRRGTQRTQAHLQDSHCVWCFITEAFMGKGIEI